MKKTEKTRAIRLKEREGVCVNSGATSREYMGVQWKQKTEHGI